MVGIEEKRISRHSPSSSHLKDPREREKDPRVEEYVYTSVLTKFMVKSFLILDDFDRIKRKMNSMIGKYNR
jgi:hypothetical protein